MKHGRKLSIGALVTVVLALTLALLAASGQGALAEDNTIPVKIDVTPDIANNVIRVRPWVMVEVAILTTQDFDAAQVDPGSVVFGGAPAKFPDLEDVDGDLDLDLLMLFSADEMVDLDGDSTKATLTGVTLDGTPIEGTANVKIKVTGKK